MLNLLSFLQSHYNMLVRQRVEVDYVPLYPQLGLTIWSPLAGGRLTEKTNRAKVKSRGGDEVSETVTALSQVLCSNVAARATVVSRIRMRRFCRGTEAYGCCEDCI